MQKEENEYNILHVHNWIQFFVSMYNDTTTRNNEFEIKLMEVIVSEIKSPAHYSMSSEYKCERCGIVFQYNK